MLKEAQGIERLIVKSGKTDLRYGIDKLSAIIRAECGMDPMEKGTMFLFCGAGNDRIKALFFEGDGFVLLTKRLIKGKSFQWPRNGTEALEYSHEEYFRLMEGMQVEARQKVVSTDRGTDTSVAQ